MFHFLIGFHNFVFGLAMQFKSINVGLLARVHTKINPTDMPQFNENLLSYRVHY